MARVHGRRGVGPGTVGERPRWGRGADPGRGDLQLLAGGAGRRCRFPSGGGGAAVRTSVDHAVLAPAMRVGVFGIWHLRAVTAACLAHLGFRVTGVEANAARLASLKSGVPPLYEPGLAELMDREIAAGRLHFG